MKRCALLLLAICAVAFAAGDFAKWWPGFQSAVARGDAKAVAQKAHFPLAWELGTVREIPSEADFLQNFDKYFTPEIRKAIAAGKGEQLPDGTCMVTWKARGNEYSLYFRPKGATEYVLDALSEGPA